jgi:DNA-binding NtrC family response regulator
LFTQYAWPGNVRELRNVVEVLCLLRDGRKVRAEDVPESIRSQALDSCARPQQTLNSRLTLELDRGLDALTQQIVQAALELEAGNTIKTAARLRISPRTVQRHLAAGRVKHTVSARAVGR